MLGGEGLGGGQGDRGCGHELVKVSRLIRSALGCPRQCHTGKGKASGSKGAVIVVRSGGATRLTEK